MRKETKQTSAANPERRGALRIGEVSKRGGIGIEALRFYERSGLLGRPGRTHSGYRMYEPEVLERLDFIKRAQVLGFSLAVEGHICKFIEGSTLGHQLSDVKVRFGQED